MEHEAVFKFDLYHSELYHRRPAIKRRGTFFLEILPITIAFTNDGCKSVATLASFSESL